MLVDYSSRIYGKWRPKATSSSSKVLSNNHGIFLMALLLFKIMCRRKKRFCKASRLLQMARQIAAGMKYLAHKAFIHRVQCTHDSGNFNI
jgi:hypothetical protein